MPFYASVTCLIGTAPFLLRKVPWVRTRSIPNFIQIPQQFFSQIWLNSQQMFHELLFKYVCDSHRFVLSNAFYHIKFHPGFIEYAKSKFKKKLPIGSPYKKFVWTKVWENARFYGTGVCVCSLSSLQVSVPYEAKDSGSVQSGCANFEYTSHRFFDQKMFSGSTR